MLFCTYMHLKLFIFRLTENIVIVADSGLNTVTWEGILSDDADFYADRKGYAKLMADKLIACSSTRGMIVRQSGG